MFNLQSTKSPVGVSLLGADLALIALYLIAALLLATNYTESIWRPLELRYRDTVPSIFLYMKWLLIVAVLAAVAIKRKRHFSVPVAMIFLVLFVDDAFELHELYAPFWIDALGLVDASGLRAYDFGEMPTMVILLGIVGVLLAVAYRIADRDGRSWIVGLIVLIAALAMCGVVFDMIHIILADIEGRLGFALNHAMDVGEDGGELIVGSLILLHAIDLFTRAPPPEKSLHMAPGIV